MHAFSDLSFRCMARILVFNQALLLNYPPDNVLILGPWEMELGHGYVCCRMESFFLTLLKNGEIDIIEGVHDNEHNQVTWHTAPGTASENSSIFAKLREGCNLTSTTNFTGTVVVSHARALVDQVY